MGERHTRGCEQHWREITFKPYVYRADDTEPPAVTAARERWQAHEAELGAADTAAPGPDDVGYEWRREQLLEEGGDELAELDAARGRYQAALAAVPEPGPQPAPATAGSRRRRCGYLTTAAGHRVMCDE